MTLVETYQRAHLERQLRIARAGVRHLEQMQPPAPVVVVPPPAAPAVVPISPDVEWAERQLERFKPAWFKITDGPTPSEPIEPKPPEIRAIQVIVGRHYHVSIVDMLSERRTKDLVRPRQVAMYLAKQLTPRSLPEIGRRFGNRDHTTVLHAVRKMAILISRDDDLAAEVEAMRQKCEAA